MKKIIIILGLSLPIFALLSCNGTGKKGENQTDSTKEVSVADMVSQMPEYVEEFREKPEEFSVSSAKEKKILTASGTEIFIPANIFVDETGKKIEGDVKISYKEIRSAAEIMIEQVDMSYDSAGVSYDFQTAGMFELLAFSHDKPVYIQDGKSIEVVYNSSPAGNFNTYEYEGTNWKYISGSQEVQADKTNPDNISAENLIKPIKADPAKDLIIDVALDYNHIAELKAFKNITWKYAGDKDKTEIIKILSKKISSEKISVSDENSKFLLSFKTGKESHELLIAPVFAPRAYHEAMQTFTQAQNSTTVATPVKRKTTVTTLGLVNYDRIYHRQGAVGIVAFFKAKDTDKIQSLKNIPIFHITGDNDDVVVQQADGRDMVFSKKLNNKLVALLPGNIVAVLNNEDFSKQVSTAQENSKLVFTLEIVDKKLSSAADLEEIIGSL